MSDKRPRVCPECGSDTFQAQDYAKVVSERYEVYDRFKRRFAQHAMEQAQWEIDKIRLEDSTKSLQRKVASQRKALNRLENKLLKLKRQPYETHVPSAFWDDLNENLKDEEFRKAYVAAVEEISATDNTRTHMSLTTELRETGYIPKRGY